MNGLRILRITGLLLLMGVLAACAVPPTESNSGTPETDGPTPTLITLERQPCFGFCPVYTLSIHGDGTVEYNGIDHVDVTGEQTSTIAVEDVQALADAMTAAGYFEWNDAYMNQDMTDQPYVFTSITLSDGTTKRIEHYYGDTSAPEGLKAVEALIDKTANVAQWVGDGS